MPTAAVAVHTCCDGADMKAILSPCLTPSRMRKEVSDSRPTATSGNGLDTTRWRWLGGSISRPTTELSAPDTMLWASCCGYGAWNLPPFDARPPRAEPLIGLPSFSDPAPDTVLAATL